MQISISLLKMHNNNDDCIVVLSQLEPLHLPANVFLEPMLPIFALLIHHGMLCKHGSQGKVVKDMQQPFTYNTSTFDGFGNEPFFLVRTSAGTISKMDTPTACLQLAVHTSSMGLSEALYHSFRHNFAQQMQIMFDANTA